MIADNSVAPERIPDMSEAEISKAFQRPELRRAFQNAQVTDNVERLYSEAQKLWVDTYGKFDAEAHEYEQQKLSIQQVRQIENSPWVSTNERIAAQFIDANFDWLSKLDGEEKERVVTPRDMQILTKSLDSNAPFNPYDDFYKPRTTISGGTGVLTGLGIEAGLMTALIWNTGASLAGVYMAAGTVSIPAVLGGLAVGYTVSKIYDMTHGGNDNYYKIKRQEAEKNGVIESVRKLNF